MTDSMDVEPGSNPSTLPVHTPLPPDPNVPPSSSNNTHSLENEVRRIIYKKRANTNISNSQSCSSNQGKRQLLDPLSTDNLDPRLLNKYNFNSKPSFIIHLEKIISTSSDPNSQSTQSSTTNTTTNTTSNYKGKSDTSNQRSPSGIIGTIAFGKRLLKHIDLFKFAFDLKTIGKNKFTVSFPDYDMANKFADAFNNKLSQIYPGEIWLAYIPNFKVIKQFIIRGVDDNDSPDEIIEGIRPPPGWDIKWIPPFEASRLKKRITRSKNNDNGNNIEFTYTDNYVVRFRSAVIPPSVIYMGKRLALEPFIQSVKRCQKCQRFGHVSKICRSAEGSDICARCGMKSSSHQAGICTASAPSCINCKRANLVDLEHEASSPSCPIFIKQKSIKKTMATHDISHAEAMRLIDGRAAPNSPATWFRPPHGIPLPTLNEFFPQTLTYNYNSKPQYTYSEATQKKKTRPKIIPSIITPPQQSHQTNLQTNNQNKNNNNNNNSILLSSPSPTKSFSLSDTDTFTVHNTNANKYNYTNNISNAIDNNHISHYSQHTTTTPSASNQSRTSLSLPSSPNCNNDDNNNHNHLYLSKPELLKEWVSDCLIKFNSIRSIDQDILSEIGLTLLNKALITT